MTYAVIADLVERFGDEELIPLTDRAGFGSRDDGAIARALAEAGAEIDGYLAKRYTLPLSTTPPLLTNLQCALAREALYTDAPTETVKDRAANARRVLRDLAAGLVELGLPPPAAPVPAQAGILVSAPARRFGDDC